MTKSIQNRILLLIILIGVLMIAAVVLTRVLDNERVETMLNSAKDDKGKILQRVVMQNFKNLRDFAVDNTNWDEMANFTRNPDTVWAKDNIDISLPTFDIQMAWVFNSNLDPIYSTMPGFHGRTPEFPLSRLEIQDLSSDEKTYDFYLMIDTLKVRVCGGKIFSSLDKMRANPSGYLFVGRVIKLNNTKEIGEFAGTGISINLVREKITPPADSISKRDYKVINFLPLKNWKGETTGWLRSESELLMAKEYENRSQTIIQALAAGLILALALFALILIRMINRPLKLLTNAMITEDADATDKLQGEESEFGKIATLMKDFFIQKKLLVSEIEERKKMEVELKLAVEKAEESDRLKTAFLNNISHEIRTPMNAIVGFSELLSEPRLTAADRTEFIAIIKESTNRLLRIITDLISLSTLDTGQAVIEEECVNLNGLLKVVMAQVSKETDSEKVELRMDAALKDDHSFILADRTKLTQVLANLLNNAAKFTSEGIIDFGYSIRKGEIEFFVRDTGIGIPAEKFEQIFARFQQVDDSMSRPFGGAGLGLPISKAYVELMGGRIWLKSEIGKGSEFYFTIPYKT